MVLFLQISQKSAFKLERNKNLTFIVVIIDIDWYEKIQIYEFLLILPSPSWSICKHAPLLEVVDKAGADCRVCDTNISTHPNPGTTHEERGQKSQYQK